MDTTEHPPEAMSREEAEHARICSLPFGHQGGHWWDEWHEPPSTAADLIHAWHAKAVGADAAADAFMASRERPTYQVVTWRAQADIWRLCAEQLSAITGERTPMTSTDTTEPVTHYSPAATEGALSGDIHGTLACGAEHWGFVTDDPALVTCEPCKE